MKTVRDIVVEYIQARGLDGLSGDECSCIVDDLAPCGEIREECRPGKLVPCDPDNCAIGGCDFHIDPEAQTGPVGEPLPDAWEVRRNDDDWMRDVISAAGHAYTERQALAGHSRLRKAIDSDPYATTLRRIAEERGARLTERTHGDAAALSEAVHRGDKALARAEQAEAQREIFKETLLDQQTVRQEAEAEVARLARERDKLRRWGAKTEERVRAVIGARSRTGKVLGYDAAIGRELHEAIEALAAVAPEAQTEEGGQ